MIYTNPNKPQHLTGLLKSPLPTAHTRKQGQAHTTNNNSSSIYSPPQSQINPNPQQDYYNVLMFFDVVALFVTFSRLLAMHLALKYIDTYKVISK